MMLMTKFGKFKLRLIATINLSVLLSVFNIASTTSNYWLKYIEHGTGVAHSAGLWRSCPDQGDCVWKEGIFDKQHSFWSICVRFFITLGTITNFLALFVFIIALIYKINKKSRYSIKFLEIGNFILISSFISILIGFCVFISNNCNFSIWLHVLGMLIIIITSNMLTRTFAAIYFYNTRSAQCCKSVETGISHSKLPCEPDEKIALASVENNEQLNGGLTSAIEMNKVSEANGSNEALIPSAPIVAEVVNTTPAIVEVNSTATAETVQTPQETLISTN